MTSPGFQAAAFVSSQTQSPDAARSSVFRGGPEWRYCSRPEGPNHQSDTRWRDGAGCDPGLLPHAVGPITACTRQVMCTSFACGLPVSRFLTEGRNLLCHVRCPAVAASSPLDTCESQLRFAIKAGHSITHCWNRLRGEPPAFMAPTRNRRGQGMRVVSVAPLPGHGLKNFARAFALRFHVASPPLSRLVAA